jgi:hypothetical protein
MTELDIISEWKRRVVAAKEEAHRILATHESSASSRVVILEDLLARLSILPVDVQDYFREATVCLENNLLRASVVLAWAGFFHVLAEKLYVDHEAALRLARPKWTFKSLEELKESNTESAILDVAKEVGLMGKANLREYQGQLSKRNQCAHPTLYRPSLNSALGYVDDMIRQTIRYI